MESTEAVIDDNAKVEENTPANTREKPHLKLSRGGVLLSICFIMSYVGFYLLIFNKNICVMIAPLDDKTARITKYIYLAISLIILSLFFFVFKRDVWKNFDLKSSKLVTVLTCFVAVGFLDLLFSINSNSKLKRALYTLIASFAVFVISYCIVRIAHFIIFDFWHDLDKKERYIFLGICGIGSLFCFILYLNTSFFSYPTARNDVLFDFDNQFNYANNYFLNIFEGENDMRHLFVTLSTMPFAILPFMISKVISFIPGIYGLLLTLEQVVIAAYIILLLIKFLKIEDFYVKIAFAVLVLCSSFCFIDMALIEKFMFGLFYIFLTLSLTFKHSNWKWLAFAFAVGSLTTSAALGLVVLFYDRKPFKEYIKETLCFLALFLTILCLFGQLNLLVFVSRGYKWVMSYSSYKESNFKIKFMQTIIFVANLFLVPQLKISNNNIRQMNPEIDGLFWVGLIIVCLSIVAIILNRKDKFTWICAYWQLFLFVMIFIVGYGTASNATFIYSAIFAWSSFALLYKFLASTLKNKKVLLCTLGVICIAMLVYNSVQMAFIVDFVKNDFTSIF